MNSENRMDNEVLSSKGDVQELIEKLLFAIGEDVSRPGLIDTPQRVARAWKEWAKGYAPYQGSLTTFPSTYTGLVARKGIPFASMCEHHLAPYTGTIDFAYTPDGQVLGISKIIRLIRHYTARLTIQEDLTADLVEKFEEVVKPKGCIIKITAYHSCESTRGVNAFNVPTVTLLTTGVFQNNPLLVQQFSSLSNV